MRGLAEELRAAGLRVWFDEWVLKPGDDIDQVTKRGLEAARVQVLCLSRQTDERSGEETIRWMNVTRYLKDREDKTSRQIVFEGERLDMQAVWKLRDRFFPPRGVAAR